MKLIELYSINSYEKVYMGDIHGDRSCRVPRMWAMTQKLVDPIGRANDQYPVWEWDFHLKKLDRKRQMYSRIAKCLGRRRCGLPIFDRLTQRCDQSARQTIELRLEDKLRVHPFVAAFWFSTQEHHGRHFQCTRRRNLRNNSHSSIALRVRPHEDMRMVGDRKFVVHDDFRSRWNRGAGNRHCCYRDPCTTRRRRQRLQRLQFFKKWRQDWETTRRKKVIAVAQWRLTGS